jgi:hypothetical protein
MRKRESQRGMSDALVVRELVDIGSGGVSQVD